ncbi:hypothetical protein BBBOND_0312910 [Babesia bigemina]|uniref:6-Cys domain-containing protein n=1 Tax=Babesia bigemina TaxID=5866 RepID=A0A061DA32_BABBI|nr:hypothetical protein BBBOND_0312910 [Babesia bigemina]CDR97388.1 hypothetical protein BBBOND_0312910 [Babesia bigemina]|eukprot:XP_012769574.1 hypothetical protein BBBOND_0312910 [Babesia bigemina]
MLLPSIGCLDWLPCDFGDPPELLSTNALAICNIDIDDFVPAPVICPRRVNDTEYVWHPQPTSAEVGKINTYVGGYGALQSVALSAVIRTESSNNLVWLESEESGVVLHFGISIDELVAITENRLIFICGPRDLVLSDTLQRELYRLDGFPHMQAMSWTPTTPLTEEIDKIGNGLGVVLVQRGRENLPLQGCGSRDSPLFAAGNEVTVDPVTGTRSCVVDPMSRLPIGFVCEGNVEPSDCMRLLLNEDGDVVIAPEPHAHWNFKYNRPWVVVQYFNNLALPPFSGECKCIDSETDQVKARIEIRPKTEYECDIASMIFRNRVRPISGPWCSVVLDPGSTLTIRLPETLVNTFYIEQNEEDNDEDIEEDVITVPFSQQPSVYEYETEFLPNDLIMLRQMKSIRRTDLNDEIPYHQALAGDAIELDVSQISRGEVKLKYRMDRPLALKSGTNSFFYHWSLISRNHNVLEKTRAIVNVSFAFTHYYNIVACDRKREPVFDREISKQHCVTKSVGNGIGETYQCTFNETSHILWAGINCAAEEELLPDNCGYAGYDLRSNNIMPLPSTVFKATAYPIPGFQLFDMWFQHGSFTYACICVDQRGYETSRLILEFSQEEHKEFTVLLRTGFNRLLPYQWLPWHNVKLLLDGPTSNRSIVMQHTSKHVIELQVGTTLSLHCGVGPELRGFGRIGNITTTWLPEQLDEFHYTVVHTSLGRTLTRKSHKDSVVPTSGGLEVRRKTTEMRPAYKQLMLKLPMGAIVISKDPFHKKYVPMRFVCGKTPTTSDLSTATGNPSTNSNITESSGKYTWHLVKIKLETTDPYMQGCGVTYETDELFKRDTPKIYDENEQEIGCMIDLQAAKEAAFYCPGPYLLDPPNCFNKVYVEDEVKHLGDVSQSLVASHSNHFVVIKFDSELVGRGETLRQTPPLGCRCVTTKGIVLSTIRIKNYYA